MLCHLFSFAQQHNCPVITSPFLPLIRGTATILYLRLEALFSPSKLEKGDARISLVSVSRHTVVILCRLSFVLFISEIILPLHCNLTLKSTNTKLQIFLSKLQMKPYPTYTFSLTRIQAVLRKQFVSKLVSSNIVSPRKPVDGYNEIV